MSWRDRPMAGLDTETTGIDTETCRIVTACVGLATPQGWSARNWLLRQPEPIPAEATAIHGITTEHANAHGEDPAEAVAAIRDDLYKAWSMGMPVVGYNLVYDLTLLDRECRRLGLGVFEVRGPVVDPFVIDKQTSRRRGSRKLVDTAAHFGVPIEDGAAHGAEADALAACRVAWMMCGRVDARMPDGKLRRLGGIDLEQLHRLQIGWKAEQAKSFIAYRQRQGQSVDGIRPEWPMVPYDAGMQAVA